VRIVREYASHGRHPPPQCVVNP
jgi:hypothetical protein